MLASLLYFSTSVYALNQQVGRIISKNWVGRPLGTQKPYDTCLLPHARFGVLIAKNRVLVPRHLSVC